MLSIKEEKFITAGEFARLAQSTKRTVQWYSKNGLLTPKKVNSKGYRFYSIAQIIDFQVIMLLRKLDFSLPEIKRVLRKNASTKALFMQKKQELLGQVSTLERQIQDISSFYQNLEDTGILIKPVIKTVPSFKAYILEKVGPYSQILNYCLELKDCFSHISKDAVFFVLFPDREYAPKKDRMQIGVVISVDMRLKETAEEKIFEETIPSFKALNYTHIGPPALISMFIMQMHTFMEKNKLKQDLSITTNELEFYLKSDMNGHHDKNTQVSEINIPIV